MYHVGASSNAGTQTRTCWCAVNAVHSEMQLHLLPLHMLLQVGKALSNKGWRNRHAASWLVLCWLCDCRRLLSTAQCSMSATHPSIEWLLPLRSTCVCSWLFELHASAHTCALQPNPAGRFLGLVEARLCAPQAMHCIIMIRCRVYKWAIKVSEAYAEYQYK